MSDFLAGALDGVRVLDVTRFLAGPYASWILAELGADVLKVEDPDRPDEARSVGPYFVGGQSLYFSALNTGKRSLAVRMRQAEGRDVLLRLAATCDVVLDNQRPGVMDRLGLGHGAMSRVNPDIVTVSLSGFGSSGPLRDRPGYDYTIQALTGVMSMTGEPGTPPGKAGISYVDHSGGLAAAGAVCAALVARTRRGHGGHVDLALYDIQLSMLTYLAAWCLNAGYDGERTPSASHPTLVPAQNFATADGYVSIFVGNDAMWARMAAALADPAYADERFARNGGRHECRLELVALLTATLLGETTQHWVDLLGAAGVPCSPVNTLGQALAAPQVGARSRVGHADHPVYGGYDFVRGPLPVGEGTAPAPAPVLGEHTSVLLREAQFDDAEVQSLLASGAVMDAAHDAGTSP